MSRHRADDEGSVIITKPFLSNEEWTDYMRGQNAKPVNAVGVYGTHRDYRYKWVTDDNDPQHKGKCKRMAAGKRPMPVYGPVDWDSLWPNWPSVGLDFPTQQFWC